MNGKERIQAVLADQSPDRIPVMASTLANAIWLEKVEQNKFHTDPEVLAQTVTNVSRSMGLDGIYLSSDNCIIHEALGGNVRFPVDDEPWPEGGRLLKELKEWKHLTIPNPYKAGRMPMMLEAAKRAVELVGDEFFIEANIDSGPFQLAMTLLGSEAASIDVLCNRDEFCEFLEFATDVVIAYGRAMAGTGVHGIQFGESSAGLVGPDTFKDVILKYDKRVIKALQAEGVAAFLHMCGRSTHHLEALKECGADCIEIDAPTDLDDAFDVIGPDIVIRGNVSTMLLLEGPEDEIARSARQCVEKSRRHGGRLILSPGCGVPKYTPASHVRALANVVKL